MFLQGAINPDGSIKLDWSDGSSGETGFKIEKSFIVNMWSVAGTVGAAETTLDRHQGHPRKELLLPRVGVQQPWEFRQLHQHQDVHRSGRGAGCTHGPVGRRLQHSSVLLTWTDVAPNESGYRVKQPHAGAWAEIGTVASNVVQYIDAAASPNTSYVYRVRAYSTVAYTTPVVTNYSAYTAESAAATPEVLPAPITVLSAQACRPRRCC